MRSCTHWPRSILPSRGVSMGDAERNQPRHDDHRRDAPVRHATGRDFDDAFAAFTPAVLLKVAIEYLAMAIRAEHGPTSKAYA